MSQTRLLALVLAAVLAVAGGWYFGTATQPVERASLGNGKLMFPDLTAKLRTRGASRSPVKATRRPSS